MAVTKEYADYLRDLFADFGDIAVKRMFGGAGVFRDGLMFALASDEVLYFKADDVNRAFFETAGSGPFTYESKGVERSLSYYECPAEVLDDSDELVVWARSGFDAALRANAAKPKKRKS